MSKKRSFKLDGRIADVPEESADYFIEKYPDAVEVKTFLVDQDTADVPLDKVDYFTKKYSNAKPLFEDEPTKDFTKEISNVEPFDMAASIEGEPPPANMELGIPPPPSKQKELDLDDKTKAAINKSFSNLPINALGSRKAREAFYNSYASSRNLNPSQLRDYGERLAADEILTRADDLVVKGDIRRAEQLYLSQVGKRTESALDRLSKMYALSGDQEKSQEYANELDKFQKSKLPQVGTGSYKQPSYFPTEYGYGKDFKLGVGARGEGVQMQQGETIEGDQGGKFYKDMEKSSDTEETQSSKYLNDIADAVERLTPGKAQVEMIESGINKTIKGATNLDYYSIGNPKNVSAALNLVVGLGETALGTILGATPSGAANFMPFEVATTYLPENVSGWLMPVSKGVSEYYKGEYQEEAQNVGFILDTALFGALHMAAKGVKGKIDAKKFDLGKLDPEAIQEGIKAAEERLKQYGGNTIEYKEAVTRDAKNTLEGFKEISTIAEGKQEVNPTEPIRANNLLEIPEGTNVEFTTKNGKESGVIDRLDDGTWVFENENGTTEIPVKDKTNPIETLQELGIDIVPDVAPEQVAKAMADAERVGWVEDKGKRYFVSLGNPMIEGSYDLVFRQNEKGGLNNVFDSQKDITHANNRKLKLINKLLEQEGLPSRDKVNQPPVKGKVEPIQEVKPVEVVKEEVVEPIKEQPTVDKLPTVEEPIVEQQPVAEKIVEAEQPTIESTPTEPVSEVKVGEPVIEEPVKVEEPQAELPKEETVVEEVVEPKSEEVVVEEPKVIKDQAKKIADKIRAGKVNRPSSFSTNTPASLVWDSALEVAAKTVEVTGDVAQGIADAIKHIKDSEWYKGLEESKQKAAEKDLKDYLSESEDVFPLGIKNESAKAENKYLGIDQKIDLTKEQKRDVKTVQENAKRFIEDGGDPELLISETILQKRQLNAEQLSVILDYKVKKANEIKKVSDTLIEDFNKGKDVEALQERLRSLTDLYERANDALEISGYEQGLAFRMRQVMKNSDYTLAESERKWKIAANGAEIPNEIKQRFSEIETKLNESEARIEELQKANERLQTARVIRRAQTEVNKKAGDKLRAFAAKIESGQISKLGGYKSSTGFDAAWDLALKAVSETLNATGSLADAIEAGLIKIRKSKWYEDLTDKKKFEQDFEDHFNKEFKKAEYSKPFIDENGKLDISFQLIKEIVSEGVTDVNDLVQKVKDAIKDELPDVTDREVKEAITEYGKTASPSKDALLAEIRELKRTGRLELGLDDAKSGQGVKRSGIQRDAPTDYQRELQRKINEEMKKYPADAADIDRKWKSAVDRVKTGLKNSIADITKRIDDINNGTAEPKKKKEGIVLDEEGEQLRQVKKDLQAQLTELEGKPEMSDEQRISQAISSAERSIEEYQRRLDEINNTGTYTEKVKKDTPYSDKLETLKLERDRLKAEYENALENSGAAEIKATKQAIERKQREIDQVLKQIKNSDPSFKKKPQSKINKNDPDYINTKARLDQAKQLLDQLREESGEANKRRLELFRKRIADRTKKLEAELKQLNEGTWKKKEPKEDLMLDDEIIKEKAKSDALKFERDVLVEKELMKNRSLSEKTKDLLSDVWNLPKSLLSSADLSAPLRQGFLLSVSNPKAALQAGKVMFKHMMSEKSHDAWINELRHNPQYKTMRDAKLYLTEPNAKLSAMDERFASNLAHKIWGWGKVVKGSERAYVGYLNKLRVDVFNDFHDSLLDSGLSPKEIQAELKSYADFINNATGRGSLGKVDAAVPLLNTVMFSPRYLASRVKLLKQASTGFYGMTPKARMKAIKDFGLYVGTVSTVLTLAKYGLDAEVELDPRSSDFGKMKIGNTRYDLMAGFQQPIVFASRMLTNKTKTRGKVRELGRGYKGDTRVDVAEKFARTKASPSAGVVYDYLKGKTFDGKKFSWEKAAINSVSPLMWKDVYDTYRTDGASKAATEGIPALFGIGVQNYDNDKKMKND